MIAQGWRRSKTLTCIAQLDIDVTLCSLVNTYFSLTMGQDFFKNVAVIFFNPQFKSVYEFCSYNFELWIYF